MYRSLTCFLIVVGVNSTAVARVIDDFSVGPITVERAGATPATAEQTSLNTSHVLGGKRFILVGDNGSATQTATVDTAASKFSFSTNNTGQGYLTLRYGSVADPLNFDLTADGSQFLAITLTDIIGNSIPSMRIYGGGTEEFIPLTVSVSSPNDIAILKVPFTSLNQTIIHDLDRLEIQAGRIPANRQFSLLGIAAIVPEPATFLLAGANGVLLFSRHRGRAK